MIEVIVFAVAGAACIVGALGVVFSKNPVHAALSLVMTLFGVAVLFVAREAHFLAAVQVIVYAGAIVVLFLFVIMLAGVDRSAPLALGSLRAQRGAALIFGGGAVATTGLLVVSVVNPTTGARAEPSASVDGATGAVDAAVGGTDGVRELAHSLFSEYVYAFELTSVLLIVAVVGTVVLARRSATPSAVPSSTTPSSTPSSTGTPTPAQAEVG